MTITNPYAWAVGTVDGKTGEFKWRTVLPTRKLALLTVWAGEVVRKVFIQPAEQAKRSR